MNYLHQSSQTARWETYKNQITSLRSYVVFEESCAKDREEDNHKGSRSSRKLSYKTEGSTNPMRKWRQRSTFNCLFSLLRSAYLLYFPK